MSVEAFFREFDGNSTITKVVNDLSTSASRDYLTWNGSDVIINYSWTLPVPILLIGSTLSYSIFPFLQPRQLLDLSLIIK